MSFEIILVKDRKGLLRLRQLHIKLYFSTESNLGSNDVKEDRRDPILLECMKSLLKNKESFRNSFEIWEVPLKYLERTSIDSKFSAEYLVIKDKKEGDSEPKLLNIPRSRTIAMSIYDAARYSSSYNMIGRSTFKPTAFSGYWDRNVRSPPMPPIYCDDEDL